MIVKRFLGTSVFPVATVSATAALPAISVFMPAGNYVFAGQGYDCTAPGKYSFWSGTNIQNRIVAGTAYETLSAVSWNTMHASADEALLTGSGVQVFSNAGMKHKWRVRCGYIADYVVWLMPQFGISARKVHLNALPPFNGVDDGHYVPEVYVDGAWRAWDMTNAVIFRDASGAHLSVAQIVANGVLNCTRERIDGDPRAGCDVPDGFCLATYSDLTFLSAVDQDAWFDRIYKTWSL